MVHSNSVLMNTRNTKAEYDNLDEYILIVRRWYKRMCDAVVEAVAKNPRAQEKAGFGNRPRASQLPLEVLSSR